MFKKGVKLWESTKKIIPGGVCFIQKEQKIFYLEFGHHIIKKLKAVMYGH